MVSGWVKHADPSHWQAEGRHGAPGDQRRHKMTMTFPAIGKPSVDQMQVRPNLDYEKTLGNFQWAVQGEFRVSRLSVLDSDEDRADACRIVRRLLRGRSA